jgi:hypothetical protein
MPGAIGVVLYLDVLTKTGGSLSIWASEDDLRRFVALPRHTAIMRRYRDRVRVRATTWTTENFSLAEAWEQRDERLATAGTSERWRPSADWAAGARKTGRLEVSRLCRCGEGR